MKEKCDALSGHPSRYGRLGREIGRVLSKTKRKQRAEMLRTLEQLIVQHNDNKSLRASRASNKRQGDRRRCLRNWFTWLFDQGYELQNVRNIKPRHIQVLVRVWEATGYAAGTLQNYVSILRVFLRWISKEEMLAHPGRYFSDPSCMKRQYVRQQDCSVETAAKTPAELVTSAAVEDKHVAVQLLLMQGFGLRPREAWQLHPCEDDEGGQLRVHRGTKGGRMRVIPVREGEQRELLDYARAFVGRRPVSMIPENYSLKGWRARFYYVCAKIGLTKAGQGVTAYGFRYSRLNQVYAETAGFTSPLKGGLGALMYPERDAIARDAVSREAGHSRRQISNCYVGGY